LEKSGLEWTALCLWKFQQGAGEVGVAAKWSETASDSNGVVEFVRN